MVLFNEADYELSKRFYIAGPYDPTVTPVYAARGALYRRIGPEGGATYEKMDDGETTNWVLNKKNGSDSGGSANPSVVKVVASQNVDINSAPASIDDEVLNEGDLILLTAQSGVFPWEQEPKKNGVYVFNGEGNALTRDASWVEASHFVKGRTVFVEQNTSCRYRGTIWYLNSIVNDVENDPKIFIYSAFSRVIAQSIEPYANGMIDLGNEKEFSTFGIRQIFKRVHDGEQLLIKAPNSPNNNLNGDGILIESGSGGNAAKGGDIRVKAGNFNTPGKFVLERVSAFNPGSQLAADPVGGMVEGDIYYNTVSKKFRFYNGSVWGDI